MPIPATIDDLSTIAGNNYPEGTEPVFPNLDNYLRAHASFIAQLRDQLAVEGLPLSAVMWWGGTRAGIPARFIPLDGQSLSRTTYAALWTQVSGGGYPIVSESAWSTTAANRASFSLGDGATTFRAPDLNGKQGGSVGALAVRGDGASSAGTSGLIQDSQNLAHSHTASSASDGAHSHTTTGTTSSDGSHTHGISYNGVPVPSTGVWSYRPVGAGGDTQSAPAGTHSHTTSGSTNSTGAHAHAITVNADGGSEARMKSATGVWIMRAL